MYYFKKINLFLFLSLMAFGLSSCYEEPDWLGDNVTTEGKHFPVIAGFDAPNGTDFKVGETAQLDLRYWSVDPISTIKLHATIDDVTTEVSSKSYTQNFQEDSQTDMMLFDYTIPDVAVGTAIRIDAEIINENGLTRNTVDGGTANRPSITLTVIE